MSRNLCGTECVCDYWKFQGQRELPSDAPGLMTVQEYLADIGWKGSPDNQGHGWGYGFPVRLNGVVLSWWRSEDGLIRSTTPVPGYRRDCRDTRYAMLESDLWYRWKKLQCLMCRRLYVGWYVAQPRPVDEPWIYQLSDLSFYHAFNDEPAPEDVAELRVITVDVIAQALFPWPEAK